MNNFYTYLKSVLIIIAFFTSVHAQWISINTPPLPTSWTSVNILDASDSNTAAIIVNEQIRHIYLTVDKGKSWKIIDIPDRYPTAMSVIDSANIWLAGDTAIYKTSNSGESWVCQFNNSFKTNFLDYIEMFDTLNGIAVGDAPTSNNPALILSTSDGGMNWVSRNDSFLLGAFSRDQFYPIDFINMQIGFFSDTKTNKIFKTNDGGQSWFSITNPGNIFFMLKFFDEKLGIVISQGIEDKWFRTNDGGNSWIELELKTKSYHHDIEFSPVDASLIWATDYYKLYFSADTGNTWKEVRITEESLQARNIKFTDSNHGWLLCDNGKIFFTDNGGGVITRLENENKFEYYHLEQNYPNPFNPRTNFEFRISDFGLVTLKVYDILGREAAVIVNEEKASGKYSVTWDASKFSSGVYLYELSCNGKSLVKKMMLLK